MKKILILFAAFFLVSGTSFGYLDTMVSGGTNNVAATTTNTYTGPIFEQRTGNLSIGMCLALDGAGTTGVVLKLDRSVDGTNWVAGGAVNRYLLTPAATATVMLATNVSVGAVRFWRVGSVENDNATAVTNLIIKFCD